MSTNTPPHTRLGEGPHRVLAVHGWLGDRNAWQGVLADLDSDNLSYAFIDLRGYGEARDTPGAYTTREGAEDVLALADSLGWDRFSLIGHSMGGTVAQRVLTLAPQRIRRLVGISPVPASGMPMPPEQWELFSTAAERPENRRAIIDFTTGGRRPAAWLDRMVRRSLDRSDPKAFRAWLGSWAAEDFHAELVGSRVPALAVLGGLDPAISSELMARTWLRWFPDGRQAVLAESGHYPMDETPLQLIRTVEDFLRADDAS